MKGIKITTLCIAVVSIIGMANAETCVKTTYNVVYSCGAGTESGTLPADGVANYNTSFTPAALTSACTPPTGYRISGWSVYIDGVEYAYTTSSFTYSFTSDVVIQPHYLSDPSGVIATPADLAANLGVGGTTYTYVSGASGTWHAVFPYGIVNGVSKCTTVMPENTAYGWNSGLIATDQSAIENATAGGQYCYCKMTEPNIAASPWVFRYDRGYASYCASDCASYCGNLVHSDYVDGRRFRASVFAAAGD
ncbi:MAG: hypothetical protein E7011_01730 [Alphaproteobacteria bacterium]|nr:hypothetical protein [Alphaproteobacteria bacterium]